MFRDEYIRRFGNVVTRNANFSVVREDGSEVKAGDELVSKRGVKATFRCATRFNCPEMGKSGKVVVELDGGHQMEYYDGVYDVEVKLLVA